jgi:signal transduction histidine kinase
MRVIGWLRHRWVEAAWVAFSIVNVAAMLRWQAWETIPFHFIWVSLTIVYGFRVWGAGPMLLTLTGVQLITGAVLLVCISNGSQEWGELFEVPLMSAMFLAMVWHANRRQQAMLAVEGLARGQASLLESQERFLHDASHELRTPVTIARGHLELLRRDAMPEVEVALDELGRMERIVDRLLLLARTPGELISTSRVEVDAFLEDVFMRWTEVAPRSWRLGELAHGTLVADEEALRGALDALLENAVKYTDPGGAIELRAHAAGGEAVLQVVDDGPGISPDAVGRVFDRFARADAGRARSDGGAGLGLAIVDAIVKAHGGVCSVSSRPGRTVFSLRLPGFDAVPALERRATVERV